MGTETKIKGRTIHEIAAIIYGEKGAMSALARGLGVTPGYLNNVATGNRGMTKALEVKLVLACREAMEMHVRRNAGIAVLLADLEDIKMGDPP